MLLAPTTVAYQATDLARKHRQVLDAARHGGALIRDKDGAALVLATLEAVERERTVADIAVDLVRAGLAIMQGERSAAGFGDLGWVSVLPPEAQREFYTEMTNALLLAASGLSLRNMEQLLGDWRATADTWADEAAREQLLAGSPAPLHDVEL